MFSADKPPVSMVFPMDAKRGSDYRLTLSAAFRSYHKYSNIQRKEKAWVLPGIGFSGIGDKHGALLVRRTVAKTQSPCSR
jgi:hypothetical protein